MKDDKTKLVNVFSSNNNYLFLVAKSVLDDSKIQYFSTGDNLNTLEGYSAGLSVFEKEADTAREMLRGIVQTGHTPENKFDKKLLSSSGYIVICLFLIFTLIMIYIFLSNP